MLDYDRFLTPVSLARKPSVLREITRALEKASPEVIVLAGGMPNPATFPFKSASFQLKDGSELTLDSATLDRALQYGPTQGFTPLVEFLKTLTVELHSPPQWQEMSDLIVTNGAQDGLCMSLEMLLQPGDPVLVQEPCYTGSLAAMRPLFPRLLGVASDSEGMLPSALLEALRPWTPEQCCREKTGVPKVLYINPVGSNPTGAVMTEARRREVYDIACRYNILILEDDPYFFIHFSKKVKPPSFLSLDTEGRVLRFDSFSKVISSGIRIGFVSGPKPLIFRIMLHMQVSSMHASNISQVVVWQLLNQWGVAKLLQHTEQVQQFYAAQRNAMAAAAQKHLIGLCEWLLPNAGMFFWMKVLGLRDTNTLLMEKGPASNVMVVPGNFFMMDATKPCQYFRASFSLASPDDMDKGFEKLAKLIREEVALQNRVV